jgi:cobalamin biosynthesis Mg chelatase CobN
MSRTVSTFIATALAIASLGLAGTAQAEGPEQGIAIGEPTPGQLPPATQADPEPEPAPVEEEPAPAEEAGEEMGEETGEEDHTSPAYFKSKEAIERFKRYCTVKDAEPSHSDKAFCEHFRKHHPKRGTSRPAPTGTSAGAGSTGTTTGTGSTGTTTGTGATRPATDTGDARPANGSTRPAAATTSEQPVAQAEQASKSSLPFTGFEVWQLGLLGVALVVGALAARRLLDNDN